MYPVKNCKKCLKNITVNNYDKHVNSCNGIKIKKIRGVDFDPNHGYKDGTRTVWNKGLTKLTDERIKKSSLLISKKRADYFNISYLTENFETLSRGPQIRLLLHQQNNKCNNCGIDSWLNKPITLEFEHKNGNRHDDRRENVELLCPNCHAQTDTWRGRNNKNKHL